MFFKHQQDRDAQYMAAFISKNPSDRTAFDQHWKRILDDRNVLIKTILYQKQIAGHIAKFVEEERPELTYWIDRKFWNKGVVTKALQQFLEVVRNRPIYARAARDNIASIRVLEKNDFVMLKYEKGFSNARNKVIDEVLFELDH